MAASPTVPLRAKELHPSLLIQPKKPTPFWRSLSLRSIKKSDAPSNDSGVADLSGHASPVLRNPSPASPNNEAMDVNINDIADNTSPGPQELPRYSDGYNFPAVTVNQLDLGAFWSGEPYISENEDVPKGSHGDQVVEETFKERMKERLQEMLERNELYVKLMQKRKERKEGSRL
ncbi:hypothetical protein L207DRAFT_536898 [Hyaloscypha variabilis F]|uniref:Uncharacterized protein n=1 Tax=Hyaloscypha variabilis (strain UAMH 11265 / GT02V1 / F) TaxID=1149755 RepID=A0A2J6QYS1_HYAVF|nr:hypothetical protein L207DRAFT_536898 [Hyaloscypha variabilis F]